ncbi:hypothetical protein [Mycolicibacterium fortuitum]|uniref:hypothetical protein n=1 Tax=Mycolicibacterium fortuitum TaxID=1766 RepID=UPI0026364F69|nr:hypothetical protein [Mycolicibacterium fortuitum]
MAVPDYGGKVMSHDERAGFDAPEADVVEQLIPVGVDDEHDALGDLRRVRISPDADAAEADLIDQAIVVPLDDESGFDR